ncbi:pre-rRNA processing protein FTSJ3 [Strongyloides ratti]|uniref:Putative rRNA methyltransferase n=1 Tax=Strongyloides ratti TaxID=34506 RepID=A0A090L2K5_STRRB|nr:pre-rRNA processing protein FTSJ3 [Strongyloides ratti]CEF64051.1 pre-rRNA processing protein FTSJ3 [Strongyloides ratti]
MGKKSKVGKQRKDKFYHLAKETGYRSRAAFKLLQLNKRFEFLQNSRALVDLCAAPGGWLQVASQTMPPSSICIGVDLDPIKPIKNCITFQGDITHESTRQRIRRELNTWLADTVIHDGAPNVGMNWIHDAFQQNCLVLMALKLATQVLKKNGYFVTKVFRSADHQALVGVFDKLFRAVHIWKPAASRLESAEIFMVCEGYKKPNKVPPELLDPKQVFKQIEEDLTGEALKNQIISRKSKKLKAVGYDVNNITQYNEVKLSDYLSSTDHILTIAKASKIVIDEPRWESDPLTTETIKDLIKDIKVLGPSELRVIFKWRRSILDKLAKEKKQNEESEHPHELTEEEKAELEKQEIDKQIEALVSEEKAADRRKKRRENKMKSRFEEAKKLEMVHEGDSMMLSDDIDLFSLSKIRKKLDLQKISDVNVSMPDVDSDKEDNDSGVIASGDDDDVQYASGDDDEDLENYSWETLVGKERSKESVKEEEEDDLSDNELLHTEESGLTTNERKAVRSASWFNRDGMTELLEVEDDDDEDDDIDAVEKVAPLKTPVVDFEKSSRGKRKLMFEDKDAWSDDEKDTFVKEEEIYNSEEETKLFGEDDRIAKRLTDDNKGPKSKKVKLTPQQLALGEELIYSSKKRSQLEDWSWNRYTNNDTDLPDWFVNNEKKHCVKPLPVTKEQVQYYKNKAKEINVHTIKKVNEAKARKKRRMERRMEKAKKHAENILGNETLEHAEKIKELQKTYKKAMKKERRRVQLCVMTKGKRGKVHRPRGPYKCVDARLKKDMRAEKVRKTREKKMGKSKVKVKVNKKH